jgi:hypothetical protein
MGGLVTIRLRKEDAEKSARGDAGALRRVRAALESALADLRRRGERKAARVQALHLPAGRKERPRGWPTKKLWNTLWARSEGRCECPCRRRLTRETAELDHFLGRARAPQTPETCWLLSEHCHANKHAGAPTRGYWLRLYLEHLQSHGFGDSATAQKLRAELESEKLIEQARAIRARQGSPAIGASAPADPPQPSQEVADA